MPKVTWKPGTMLYPVPAVMITSKHEDKENVFTVSWVGTICTNPPMLSISVRPERYSYELIRKSREFAVNIPDKHLAAAADYCGVKSGKDVDKFVEMGLIKEKASKIQAPLIRQCPVSIECIVKDILELGSHHMFIAEVVAVNVEETLIDNTGKLNLTKAGLICYNHGQYCIAEKPLGKFGHSIQKKKSK